MSDAMKLERVPDPDAGLTIEQMKAKDTYDECELSEVIEHEDGGVGLSTNDYTGLGLSAEQLAAWREASGLELPEAGMTMRVYPRGLGQFHGVDIGGHEVFWQTPAERVAKRAEWLADHDRKQRERFAERREQLDRDYEALPDALKDRIDRFRQEDPGFRVESEWYELFCCTEAAKFVQRAVDRVKARKDVKDVKAFWSDPELRTKAASPTPLAETVWASAANDRQRWLLWAWALNSAAYDYDHERQKEVLGCDGDHSGNTFGAAMYLALTALETAEPWAEAKV